MNDANLKADMLQAMRRLAKSVTIISTSNGSERFAMAATAVDSLSTCLLYTSDAADEL